MNKFCSPVNLPEGVTHLGQFPTTELHVAFTFCFETAYNKIS